MMYASCGCMRLSDRAAILLCLICDFTDRGEDNSRLRGYWIPSAERWGQQSATLGGRIHVSGSGDAGALRALERRGLIMRPSGASSFAYAITEDGVLTIERLRETGRLDELRQIVRKHDAVMMGPQD